MELKNKTKEFLVTENMTLLEFLLLKFNEKSRNYVKGLLLHKQVVLNGKVITKFDRPLIPGQSISILKEGKVTRDKTDILKILYEDENIIVINKQSGLLAVSAGKDSAPTAYKLLADYVRKSDPHNRVFIVHRLDRDTSGVFMVAKSALVKKALQDNWNNIVTRRGYIAIVEGCPAKQSDTITSYLLETSTHIMYSARSKLDDGQLAITRYNVVKSNSEYSMLDIEIKTGKKNQIRVHLKELGCPIVGDEKYGSSENPINRLGLHACNLTFLNPITNEEMEFNAPVSQKFYDCVN